MNQEPSFDKEFEDALLKLEQLKVEKRKKRTKWLRKYNKLKESFLAEEHEQSHKH